MIALLSKTKYVPDSPLTVWLRHPASSKSVTYPLARSLRSLTGTFASLTHRHVRFQLTSPLAYMIAQLYQASLFSPTHESVQK